MVEYDLSTVGFLSLLATVILPVVTALVTREVDHPRVKALTLLGLSAVTSLVSEWAAAGAGFDVRAAVFNAAVGFGLAVATYFGLWKPSGVAAAAAKYGRQ